MKLGYMKKKTAQSSKRNLVPGSKIPISYLLDYINEGLTVSDFLASYPWLKRSNVEKAIREIKEREFTSRYAL